MREPAALYAPTVSILRRYAYAAQFAQNARVLVVEPSCASALSLIGEAGPRQLVAGEARCAVDPRFESLSLDEIAGLPERSFDTILWLELSETQPEPSVAELSIIDRLLSRDGIFVYRHAYVRSALESEVLPPNPDGPASRFWRVVDDLRRHFPGMDLHSEFSWRGSSIAPVADRGQRAQRVVVDDALVQSEVPCSAYWCICVRDARQLPSFDAATFVLDSEVPAPNSEHSSQSRIEELETLNQELRGELFDAAAKLCTARQRLKQMRDVVHEAQAQQRAIDEQVRPAFEACQTELEGRVAWLRERLEEEEQARQQASDQLDELRCELAAAEARAQRDRRRTAELETHSAKQLAELRLQKASEELSNSSGANLTANPTESGSSGLREALRQRESSLAQVVGELDRAQQRERGLRAELEARLRENQRLRAMLEVNKAETSKVLSAEQIRAGSAANSDEGSSERANAGSAPIPEKSVERAPEAPVISPAASPPISASKGAKETAASPTPSSKTLRTSPTDEKQKDAKSLDAKQKSESASAPVPLRDIAPRIAPPDAAVAKIRSATGTAAVALEDFADEEAS